MVNNMQKSHPNVVNLLMKRTGMSQQEAQQMVATIPQKLQAAGINPATLPPDKILQIIEQTYAKVKSGKKFTPPPKPPGFVPGQPPSNPQMAALAQAARTNNK